MEQSPPPMGQAGLRIAFAMEPFWGYQERSAQGLTNTTRRPTGLEVLKCLGEEFHGESDDVGRRAFEEGQPGWSVLEA